MYVIHGWLSFLHPKGGDLHLLLHNLLHNVIVILELHYLPSSRWTEGSDKSQEGIGAPTVMLDLVRDFLHTHTTSRARDGDDFYSVISTTSGVR